MPLHRRVNTCLPPHLSDALHEAGDETDRKEARGRGVGNGEKRGRKRKVMNEETAERGNQEGKIREEIGNERLCKVRERKLIREET